MLGLHIFNFVVSFTISSGSSKTDVGQMISQLVALGAGVLSLVAVFRVASILRAEFVRTGRYIEISSILVFFFQIYYLQYKINQAASMPATLPRRRKRKKKKPIPIVPEGEEPAPPNDP